MRAIDETGNSYGQLTVIERAGSERRDSLWMCRCSCGRELLLRGHALRHIRTNCGCTRKHGMGRRHKEHPLYRLWKAIKWRCNERFPRSKDYADRGIDVCEEWQDFEPFFEWAKDKWRPGLEIDRRDNNKGYSPENCRFTTSKANSRNRRDNRRIAINGTTKTLSEWAEISGLNHSTIQARIRRGWTEKDLLAPAGGLLHQPSGV